jgi:hypothetical protein
MKILNCVGTIGMMMLVVVGSIYATGWDDARGIGMAGSYSAVAQGYDAIGINPANLALSSKPGPRLQLFGFGSMLNNNAFSANDYKKYNGAYLSVSDKSDILDKIPESGLEFRGNSAVSALSFSVGPLALSTTLEASGSGNISKDIVELAFFGNRIGETVSISDADAEGIVHADINFAYGRKLKKFDWGEMTAGINFKYIKGLAYFEVSEASGDVTTAADGIDGDGTVIVRSALGGSGFGLDIGAAAAYRNDWKFSAGIRNLVSRINWNNDTKENEYTYKLVSLTAENADDDSTALSDEIERDIGSFSTSLAPEISFGAAHTRGDFLFATDLKIGLSKKAGVNKVPELSFGTEYTGVGFMPLRAGLAFGGLNGASLALGGGMRFSSFFIDVAWASSGTVLPSLGRGASFAISSGINF